MRRDSALRARLRDVFARSADPYLLGPLTFRFGPAARGALRRMARDGAVEPIANIYGDVIGYRRAPPPRPPTAEERAASIVARLPPWPGTFTLGQIAEIFPDIDWQEAA